MKQSQRGYSILIILLIWTSAVGLLLYILIASTASFKRTILTVLYPKPPSSASEDRPQVKILEIEGMKLISGNKVLVEESSASAKQALLLNTNSLVSGTITGPASSMLFKVQANICKGAPRLKISIDKNFIFNNFIFAVSWAEYATQINLSEGNHQVEVAFDNSFKNNQCQRNIKLDYLKFLH